MTAPPAAGTAAIVARAAVRPGRRTLQRVVFAIAVLAAASTPLAGQGIGAKTSSRYRVEIGAAASTPILEDGNGVAVRRGVGPFAAGDAIWAVRGRTALVGTFRGSVAPLRLRSMERRWSGGWAQQLDVALRVEYRLTASTALGAGLAAALLHGPDDIIPFRAGQGIVHGWGPDVMVATRIARERRLEGVIAGDAIRISPRNEDTRVVAGWIGRLRLGLRHAF